MRTRTRLRNRHLAVQLHRLVIIHNKRAVAVIDQHAAVAVARELIQAGVGHDHQVVAELLAAHGNRTVQDALRIPCGRADLVLILIARNAEQVNAADARLVRLTHGGDDALQGVLVLTGHRTNRLRLVNAVANEEHLNQLRGAQSGLSDEGAHGCGGTQAARAAGEVHDLS